MNHIAIAIASHLQISWLLYFWNCFRLCICVCVCLSLNALITSGVIWYHSNVTSYSLACIFLASRYSILFSWQVLAQILQESSEESRLMLRTRLVELDHSREFRFVTRVIKPSSLLQLDHLLELFMWYQVINTNITGAIRLDNKTSNTLVYMHS